MTDIYRRLNEINKKLDRLLASRNNVDLPDWLTSKQVMDYLSISSVTLWNYDKLGLTLPQKVNGRKRYKLSDIQDLLSKKKR